MSKKKEKEHEFNYLINYIEHVYMVDQSIGMELFNLNKKILGVEDEKDTK
jgi:hypothetical protein